MNLQPSLPPRGLRSKVIVAIALILAVFALDYFGATLWPRYAKFFPPSPLLILLIVTIFYALMVWRTEWMVSKLFPGQTAPEVRSRDRLIAVISTLLTIALMGFWIRSLLVV